MDEPTKTYDWNGRRGSKWQRHLVAMEAMLEPVDPPLIGALQLGGPVRVGDVGCGGGGTTLAVASRAAAGSRVVGYDVSAGLIEHARARATDGSVTFCCGDVETMPVPQSHDRLLSRFGVMFFREPIRAFARMGDWLSPEGRFVFAVWGRPKDNPWASVVRDTVAEFVDLPRPGPDAPGPFRYADFDPLRRLLEGAGFSRVEATAWQGALPVGATAEAAATFGCEAHSSFSELLLAAGPRAFESARDALAERLTAYETPQGVRMDASVILVTGVRDA